MDLQRGMKYQGEVITEDEARSRFQRRKIFPHLDKKKSSTDSNDNKKPEDSKNYDNAKSSKKHPSARNNAANKNGKINTNGVKSVGKEAVKKEAAPTHHLLPMPLVLLVLLCSGFYWISSFRDMMATGKPMLDSLGSMLWGQSEDDINLLVRQHITAYICIDTRL
jgi:hypothetical protein